MTDGNWPRHVVKTAGKTRIVVNMSEQWVEEKSLSHERMVELAQLPAHYPWTVKYLYLEGGSAEVIPGGAIDVRKDMVITVSDTRREKH